jgi:sugar phosphate isomerase/epimerase
LRRHPNQEILAMFPVTRRRFLQAAGGLTAAGMVQAAAAASPITEKKAPLKFKLGIVTYNIAAEWDIPTILRVCKNVGLSPVELRTTHKHGVEPRLNKDQRKEVRQRFADAGIGIWGCGTICEFHSTDQAVVKKNIETCKRFVDLAADIGGKGVKVRPNGLPKAVPIDKTLEQIGKSLIPCGKAAASAGVEIWVEVHGGTEYPADKDGVKRGSAYPPYVKKMMEHCGHPRVGLTWNSNASDIKNKSVAEYFKLLKPWIRSCHINELHNDLYGKYPYRELFRLLREIGYDRVTLAEIQGVPNKRKGIPDIAAGERLMRYYKALWTELARG